MKISYLCANTYTDPRVLGDAKYPNPPVQYDPKVGARSLESTIANASLADDLGYDWVSVSEHHFAPGIMAPNAFVLAAALSQVVKRAKIAVLGPIVSVNNPVRIAEEIALLDMLSGGRVVVFLLRGTSEEFKTYYFNPLESRERAHEAITLIERALTEPQPFGWEGRHFRYPTVSVWPGVAQTPRPPIYSSGNSPESCVFSAQHHLGLAMSFIPPDLVVRSVQMYKEEAAKAGWTPTPEDIIYRAHAIIGETEEEIAIQRQVYRFDPDAANARAPKGFGPLTWMEHRDPKAAKALGKVGPDTVVDRSANAGEGYGTGSLQFCGTPDEIVEQIRAYHELTGVGVLDLLFSNVGGPEAMERRIRLFGEKVLPRVHQIGATSNGAKSAEFVAAGD